MILTITTALAPVISFLTTAISTILVFGIIITLHELGHFFFAKLFGVRVNEFSFGMGPKLVSKQKGETTYSIRAFPIGGFVAMDGEDGTDEGGVSDGRAFCDKKPYQRFLILFAGAAMNIILGFGLLLFLTARNDLIGTNVVANIEPTAPFMDIIDINDRIVKINGHTTNSYSDVVFQLTRDADGIIDIHLIKESDPHNTNLFNQGEVVKLEDVPFTMRAMENGQSVVALDMTFFGVENSFLGTMKYSVQWTISVVKQVWFSLVDIISGRYGLNDLAGPVGTAVIIEQATTMGLDSLVMLVAFITINVGVFNLLPIPALDGGRLLFLLIEIIFRKPVPPKFEMIVNSVGMILLLGFVAVVTFNDILRMVMG